MDAMPRRRPFRLRTERLTLRMLARADITEFTRYRNLPEVARYQEWALPYTRDLAHELVDEMESMGRPSPAHGPSSRSTTTAGSSATSPSGSMPRTSSR
jgi:RimJ/RimL family protein N-acetyltransferase